MSDPRGTGKSSKTAAVVMLVVFVQVLIVAVLGLGAIDREDDEVRRLADAEAGRNAETALETILEQTRKQLVFALQDVRNNPSYRELQRLREGSGHGRHIDLVKTVYQVDPETREIYWMDGIHRLYVPSGRRTELIEQSRDREADAVADQLVQSYQQDRGLARLQGGLRFCRKFPYRFSKEGYPQALGAVKTLIALAQGETEFPTTSEDEAYLLYEEALLTAVEIAALNEDRAKDIPVSDRFKFVEIPAAVDAAVAGLPRDRSDIRGHVQACRDARQHLVGRPPAPSLRPVLELAANKVGASEDITFVGVELIGLIPNVRPPTGSGSGARHALVLLSIPAARHLVEEMADPMMLERLGLEFRIRPPGTPLEGRVAVSRNLEQVPGLELPFRAELHWVRLPQIPGKGPGEFFYWGIILLSAAGLGMGGWVIMRLYTREMRLARLKADFVSNLSHELKTPLTSIGMWTEMLSEGLLESDEDKAEGIAILTQESERLQSIVHRMLDTAKREARGTEYELQPGDLNGVVGRAAERFGRIVAEPGLDLLVALHPEPLPIQMDAPAIDDVVSNLVSNSWKYKDGSEVRIEVRTARRGRKAEITVADDGLGIPRRERSKVFEMFYRADAYLTRAAGTGLGLSLVRTIVRAHKGSVRIENGLNGKGTLFRIRLPLTRASFLGQAAEAKSIATTTPTSEAQATS